MLLRNIKIILHSYRELLLRFRGTFVAHLVNVCHRGSVLLELQCRCCKEPLGKRLHWILGRFRNHKISGLNDTIKRP